MGLRVWGLGFGVWGLGFGVWGLGFGVWGLGFGAEGLGLLGSRGLRVLPSLLGSRGFRVVEGGEVAERGRGAGLCRKYGPGIRD